MPKRIAALIILVSLLGCGAERDGAPAVVGNVEELEGFIDLLWDDAGGKLMLRIEAIDTPFIYQSALARGVGSNDLGLDRGQLGATRLVRFVRSGPKVLLEQDNLDFRASSADDDERRAVDESFATSVIWGFDISAQDGDAVVVDATEFFLRDAHRLAARLGELEEGDYAADPSRSAIYLPRTKAFPDNTEVEAIVTFVGQPTGEKLPTVAPDPSSFTVHMHHSFIRLPEDGYEPLPYDPRAGVIGLAYDSRGFIDYAAPIGADLYVNYGRRHRLEKKNPAAEVSEPVEPIVYYVDPGAPEPVRSALIDGARWWNEAFEAAGYRDAFQVRLLPDGADPMDVRYNVIQWVHRSTRGWSYGSSVLDPRSGEILKGHVTLGSLRVRQDYLIAEGLLAPYDDEETDRAMLDMSLARIRQLSAHEVGHTLGFEHNFAASTQDRASVMDYPFPKVTFGDDGELDLSDAYDEGIGDWDKRSVLYAYQDFPDDVDRAEARRQILRDTFAAGFRYVADSDARAVGSAHPDGNLWDNGADAIAELEHLLAVRRHVLARFSEDNVRIGRPLATLEEVLVPTYLLHRFQLQAVGKLIGGSEFHYALRGDSAPVTTPVSADRQLEAIDALLGTLEPAVLRLPAGLAEKIPPRPPGFPKSRETFAGATGVTFDPLAPAASAATLTLEVLLDPMRAARMNRSGEPSFRALLDALLDRTWYASLPLQGPDDALRQQTNLLVLNGLMGLAVSDTADHTVVADALAAVDRIYAITQAASSLGPEQAAHLRLARQRIERMWADPSSVASLPAVTVPPGSPIGAAHSVNRP